MANWTDEDIKAVWEKGKVVEGYDKDLYRKDCCGAWIKFDEYGNDPNKVFAWQIDHVCPEQMLQDLGVDQEIIDAKINLRPMHIKNNNSKSDDYPRYNYKVESEGNKNRDCNKWITVNSKLQYRLKKHFIPHVKQADD